MTRKFLLLLAGALTAAGWPLVAPRPAAAQESLLDESEAEANYADTEGVETLTRGPLHEAFAEPVSVDPMAGLVVAKEPPAPIDELPPQYKPAGEDVEWIPGYWAWDDERDDFIWVSGVYRVPPPDQRWVPGYWQQTDRGWQWVAGFWLSASAETLTYQDPPPASLENGPSSPAPGNDYFYTPGYWNYTNTGYRWTTGYWYPTYTNYMWMPPRYAWTPRGCVFINGYWDYRLSMRGYAFAPTYFNRSVYSRPGFSFRPMIVLNTNVLFNNLFVRPNYQHYMFGNYYGSQYAKWNIQPAYAYHSGRGGYDPMMSFYTAHYGRQGENFMQWSRNRHDQLNRDEAQRPPRTWADAVARQGRGGTLQTELGARPSVIAEPLRDVVKANKDDMKFVRLDNDQRTAWTQQAKELRNVAQERRKLERLPDGADPIKFSRPGARAEVGANVKAQTHGQFKLPPAVARVNAQANVEPGAELKPGEREPGKVRDRLRDVPPPASPDAKDVREDLRKLPDAVDRPRPNVPGANVPGERPRVPGERPRVPGERPNVPGANVPGERPNVPGANVPNVPGERPRVPGERPRAPGERPNVPGANVPAERPNVPGERPRVPGERPRVPGANVPGERPRVPAERPNVTPPMNVTPPAGVQPMPPGNVPVPKNPLGNRQPGDVRPDRGPDRTPPARTEVNRPNVPNLRPGGTPGNTPSPGNVERPMRERPQQPRIERPATPERPQQPRVERPAPPAQPQPQPRVERPAPPARPQPQPRVERPAPPARPQPQPQPQPPARPQPQPQQPRVEQPRPERPARPQAPPRAERPKGEEKENKGKGKK